MTQPPPHSPHGPQHPPQVRGTDISQRATAPRGFGPAPQPFAQPTATSPPGAGKRRKALLISLALVLIVGLGGGGWLLWRGDKGTAKSHVTPPEPKRVEAHLDWLIPTSDKDKADVRAKNPATWFAHGNVIRTRARQITAYDVKHGKEQWTVPLPGELCAASRVPDGDTAAVMYMKDRLTCNYLMAVNLKDGRQKWDLKLPGDRTGDGDYIDPRIRLAGGKAKVVGRIGSATLAAADGKLLEHDKSNLLYECRETDAPTDGKILISVVSCPGEKRDFLRKIDFATTKEDWTWKVPEGLKVLAVVEIAPVVVAVGKSEGEGPTDLLSVNSQGRTQATISLAGKAGGRVAVRNNTAYLATQPKEVSGSIKENEIEAIDLKSGLRRWTSSAGGHRVSRPIDFDDDKLLVYQAAQAGDGGRLVDLDLRDGSPTVRKRLPAESSAVESDLDFRSEIYFEDDRVFIVADITAPAKYMLMSFS